MLGWLRCGLYQLSHRGHSLSSRADAIPRYRNTLEREARPTQPLLAFVSIKGKEEAFLHRERMTSFFLSPTSCGTALHIHREARGRPELLRVSQPSSHSHGLNWLSLRENKLQVIVVAALSLSLSPFLSLPCSTFPPPHFLSLLQCQTCWQ